MTLDRFSRWLKSSTTTWLKPHLEGARNAGLLCGLYGSSPDEQRNACVAAVLLDVAEREGDPGTTLKVKTDRRTDLMKRQAEDVDPYGPARRYCHLTLEAFRHPLGDVEIVTRQLAAASALAGVAAGIYLDFDWQEWLTLAAFVATLILAAPALLTGVRAGFHALAAAVSVTTAMTSRAAQTVQIAVLGSQIRRLELETARVAAVVERIVASTTAAFESGLRAGSEARQLVTEKEVDHAAA
jgi:hypothetical protein